MIVGQVFSPFLYRKCLLTRGFDGLLSALLHSLSHKNSSSPSAPLPFLRQGLLQPKMSLNFLSACLQISGAETRPALTTTLTSPLPPSPIFITPWIKLSVTFQLENRGVKSVGVLNSPKNPSVCFTGNG